MGQSSNSDALTRSAGYDTSLLGQNLDIYQSFYNKEPLVIILIHISKGVPRQAEVALGLPVG